MEEEADYTGCRGIIGVKEQFCILIMVMVT
jgi:hypothetical protein